MNDSLFDDNCKGGINHTKQQQRCWGYAKQDCVCGNQEILQFILQKKAQKSHVNRVLLTYHVDRVM